MNRIRESVVGKCLSFFALLAFLLLQVPATAFAASGTKVTHDAIKFFVPEKRIRLEATVTDPKGVTLVRAYFKGTTQADYVFVPMQAQQTANDTYVATLPAMTKSNEALEYLFLVVNGANEVLKTEAFVVKAKDSKDLPSWQMVKDDGPMKLFTEVPNAPPVAASFSDSISLDVVESGVRFGLVAQLYSASGSASASGAATGASNAGMATVATAGISTATIVVAAAAVAGAAAAGGGGGGSAAPSNSGGTNGSTSNPFAGTWTVNYLSVTCSGYGTVFPGVTSSVVVPSTGTMPTTSIPISGSGVTGSVQYSGSVSTSGAINQTTTGSFTSAGVNVSLNCTDSGTLTKTGSATGTGSGTMSCTFTSGGVAIPNCPGSWTATLP